jgi:hypothetical protein
MKDLHSKDQLQSHLQNVTTSTMTKKKKAIAVLSNKISHTGSSLQIELIINIFWVDLIQVKVSSVMSC